MNTTSSAPRHHLNLQVHFIGALSGPKPGHTALAWVEVGAAGERAFGTGPTSAAALHKLIRKLTSTGHGGEPYSYTTDDGATHLGIVPEKRLRGSQPRPKLFTAPSGQLMFAFMGRQS